MPDFERVGTQPFEHELAHVGSSGRRLHRLQRDGGVDERPHVEVAPLFEQDAQHADGGAAQREGVFGAARLLADAEDAGERVEAVGERERRAGGSRG